MPLSSEICPKKPIRSRGPGAAGARVTADGAVMFSITAMRAGSIPQAA